MNVDVFAHLIKVARNRLEKAQVRQLQSHEGSGFYHGLYRDFHVTLGSVI